MKVRVESIRADFDGQSVATLSVEGNWVKVRPLHSRTIYTLPLAEVAKLVMDRAAKQTAAAAGVPIPTPRKLR